MRINRGMGWEQGSLAAIGLTSLLLARLEIAVRTQGQIHRPENQGLSVLVGPTFGDSARISSFLKGCKIYEVVVYPDHRPRIIRIVDDFLSETFQRILKRSAG